MFSPDSANAYLYPSILCRMPLGILKLTGLLLGRGLFVRFLPRQDPLPRRLLLLNGPSDPTRVSHRNIFRQMLRGTEGALQFPNQP